MDKHCAGRKLPAASAPSEATSTSGPPERSRDSNIRVVSLFAGAGGLDLGLRAAGLTVVLAIEVDRQATETYRWNMPGTTVWLRDVRTVTAEEILGAIGTVDVVVGGPPCQGWSVANSHRPRDWRADPRNLLYLDFLRLVTGLAPRFFLFENVKALATRQRGAILGVVVGDFEQAGYRCAAQVMLAADYGVPQKRERLILIGTRRDLPVRAAHPPPTHGDPARGLQGREPWVTVRQAIGDLPEPGGEHDLPAWFADKQVADGFGDRELKLEQPASTITARAGRRGYKDPYLRRGAIANHDPPRLYSERISRLLAMVPPGGNWRSLPPELHQEALGGAYSTPGGKSSFLRRLAWDAPAPTVVASEGSSTLLAHPGPLNHEARWFSVQRAAEVSRRMQAAAARGGRLPTDRNMPRRIAPDAPAPTIVAHLASDGWAFIHPSYAPDCPQESRPDAPDSPLPPFPPPNHTEKPLSPVQLAVASLVPPGGSIKDVPYEQLPERFQRALDAWRRDPGHAGCAYFQRLGYEQPSGVITACLEPERSKAIHPGHPRRLTVREAARLQSFPDWFVFLGSMVSQYRQVGNAVPPLLAYHLGLALLAADAANREVSPDGS